MGQSAESPRARRTFLIALFRRLRLFFDRDELTFQMTTTNALAPQKTRTFTRFSQAEQEVINARVYVGIHYRNSDATAGAQGRRVANWVFMHTLRPVDEPGDDREE